MNDDLMGKAKGKKGSDSEEEDYGGEDGDYGLGVRGGVSKEPTIASSRPKREAAKRRIVLAPSVSACGVRGPSFFGGQWGGRKTRVGRPTDARRPMAPPGTGVYVFSVLGFLMFLGFGGF